MKKKKRNTLKNGLHGCLYLETPGLIKIYYYNWYGWYVSIKQFICEKPSCQVQFSCSVVSDSLRHQGLQHARLSCLSPTPEACSKHVPRVCDVIQQSHPLSSPSPSAFNHAQHHHLFQWVSSASGGQSIGLSASESVLPMNTQDGSPLGWTGWIFLRYKGLSRVFSNTTV